MHHSYGDGDLSQFRRYHDVSVCASATLTPDNAVSEMDRVIHAAVSYRMPVYIEIPEDSAQTPIEAPPILNVLSNQIPSYVEYDAGLRSEVGRIRS